MLVRIHLCRYRPLIPPGREIPESVAERTDRQNEFPSEMWQKMGDAGFLGITVEEDHGGLAMGYQAHCIVMEELSRASGPYPARPLPPRSNVPQAP